MTKEFLKELTSEIIGANLLKKPKGIMVNFHCVNLFKEGQKTYVNQLFRMLPEK